MEVTQTSGQTFLDFSSIVSIVTSTGQCQRVDLGGDLPGQVRSYQFSSSLISHNLSRQIQSHRQSPSQEGEQNSSQVRCLAASKCFLKSPIMTDTETGVQNKSYACQIVIGWSSLASG